MTVTQLIAVVDDDTSARDALAALVRSFGFIVAVFCSGTEFLVSAVKPRITCLIADMQMPDMSGLELYLALVKAGTLIPTILVTAYPDEATRRRADKVGVIGFLAKPVDSDILLDCLRRAAGIHRRDHH
jgi:FixJ family two-component response regulator